tara:strand:- start:1620 stop:2315 length:696 start_codon:yes stop_codon:yes gene_type:complete
MRSASLLLSLVGSFGLTHGLRAPRIGHQHLGRRALVLGAAATPLASVVPPAAARIDEILDRARTGTLSTERVILRALRDELIEPRCVAATTFGAIGSQPAQGPQVPHRLQTQLFAPHLPLTSPCLPRDIDECDVLEKVEKIDVRAADEIVRTNGDLLKLRAATQDTRYEREYLRSVEQTYELGRLVEQRIRERASQINFKYQKECVRDLGDRKDIDRLREKSADFERKRFD